MAFTEWHLELIIFVLDIIVTLLLCTFIIFMNVLRNIRLTRRDIRVVLPLRERALNIMFGIVLLLSDVAGIQLGFWKQDPFFRLENSWMLSLMLIKIFIMVCLAIAFISRTSYRYMLHVAFPITFGASIVIVSQSILEDSMTISTVCICIIQFMSLIGTMFVPRNFMLDESDTIFDKAQRSEEVVRNRPIDIEDDDVRVPHTYPMTRESRGHEVGDRDAPMGAEFYDNSD